MSVSFSAGAGLTIIGIFLIFLAIPGGVEIIGDLLGRQVRSVWRKSTKWFLLLIGFLLALIGLVIVFGESVFPPRPSVTETVTSVNIEIAQSGEMETPYPYGPTLLAMDFTEVGDGDCDKYDPNLLGYEFHKYYIQPSSKGLMAVCTAGEWGPQMSLEVDAYPDGDLAIFGYGVIIGWKGESGQTTDHCTFAVKRSAGSPTVSRVFTTQEINDVPKTLALKELSFPLDSKPHKIRVVFLTDSLAVGYLDNQSLGEFKFDGCNKGKIGLVAWGTGETKIYFDNLRLTSLP